MKDVSLEQLSVQQFADALHTEFQVILETGARIPIELVSITGRQASSSHWESFALLFNGPANCPLAQRTYRFCHESIGTFDLFIVPVSVDASGRQYEAVFNRPRRS